VVLHDYALYKSTFTLLYFTLEPKAKDRCHKAKDSRYQGQGQSQGLT